MRARSENEAAFARGTEVVVTRYEKGLAYVRPSEEMAGEHEAGLADEQCNKAAVVHAAWSLIAMNRTVLNSVSR